MRYQSRKITSKFENNSKLCNSNMSQDADERNHIKKSRKKHWLSTLCRSIFGCARKNKIHVKQYDKAHSNIGIQCKIENNLDGHQLLEEDAALQDLKTILDNALVDKEIYPQVEEFRASLKKIDNLINTLNEIQGIYKTKTLKSSQLVLQTLQSKNDTAEKVENKENVNIDHRRTEKDAISNTSEEEILKFNINFDENTFIQCLTKKGKSSLIIQNAAQKNFSPLILHRCESEFVLTRSREDNVRSKIKNRKSSSEVRVHQMNQVQESHHTLPGRFSNNIINLSCFKSSLINHMTNIKEDVKTLRGILYSIECLVNKEKPALPISFQDVRKWFLEREPNIICSIQNNSLGRDLMKLEDSRYQEARIRATNFCTFYNLTKLSKPKSKPKKYNKRRH